MLVVLRMMGRVNVALTNHSSFLGPLMVLRRPLSIEEEERGYNNTIDGVNIVAPGLLDADGVDPSDVDPSWPGLNSLLRGKLW